MEKKIFKFQEHEVFISISTIDIIYVCIMWLRMQYYHDSFQCYGNFRYIFLKRQILFASIEMLYSQNVRL